MVQNCTTSSSLQSLEEQTINLNQITETISQIEINEVQLNTDDVQDMGQNLSLRRPRISLTWVLREQQQQQNPDVNKISSQERKRSISNSKHLFKENYTNSEKIETGNSNRYSPIELFNKRNKQDLKTTYSEPSLNTAVDTVPRRHRHRKRKERSRSQKFGYEIRNVDDFLSKVGGFCDPFSLISNFFILNQVLTINSCKYSGCLIITYNTIPNKIWWLSNRNVSTTWNGC